MGRVTWEPSGADPVTRLGLGALRGLEDATDHLLAASTAVAPIEEGTLIRSARADAQPTGTGATGGVGYSTVYAARQHEELTWRHDAGRQAKYLEGPWLAQRATMADLVAAAIRAELGAGR